MKTRESINRIGAILVAASLPLLASGCGKGRERGDLEKAAEEVAEGIEDAADELKKEKPSLKEAAEEFADGVKSAGDELNKKKNDQTKGE